MSNEQKTNVMRTLEQKKIAYTAHYYPHEEGVAVDGAAIAELLGEEPACVFKTLVVQGSSGQYYVFDIPVLEELDRKKAAKAVNEKSVDLIPVKELLSLTGYIRGGCSPVGMKKLFPTVFDSSALLHDTIFISGGKIGTQVCCQPQPLINLVHGKTADVTV